MPGNVEAKEMRRELRELMRSAPHVPPRYMLVWSDEMEKKYERIAQMQTKILQQMLSLRLRIEEYLNPEQFQELRKEKEDAR